MRLPPRAADAGDHRLTVYPSRVSGHTARIPRNMRSVDTKLAPVYVLRLMPIPPFEDHGAFLPPGDLIAVHENKAIWKGHQTDYDEVRARFVNAYGQSVTRAVLFNELLNLKDLAKRHLTCIIVFISGEFVMDIDNPETLQVTIDVAGDELSKLNPLDQWTLERLMFRSTYGIGDDLTVKTEMVRSFPPDNHKGPRSQIHHTLARILAASPQPLTTDKGYLEIVDCAEGVDHLAALFPAAQN